ncbi:MAG: molybdenum cofactor biosynthesis protein MoaE [Bacteroidetes bacterium]|nr:molybdenum cofactor biosynthesis protein MoaE [Bacteroidota bacterium]
MEQKRTDTFWVGLSDAALSHENVATFLSHDDAGGTVVFVGSTRRLTDGRRTVFLSYEAYGEMALAEMWKLAERAFSKWTLLRVAMVHRLGEVPVGEASVIIGVAAPHRDAAFAACRFLIDELKAELPIWKKENFDDGSKEWVSDPLNDDPQ